MRSRSISSALSPLGTRALVAMAVRTPPGWTIVTPTDDPLVSSSWRSASENPRTANFDAA